MSDATDDPMTIETARMFYVRAVKAEADAKRLRECVEQKPYPSDVEALEMENEALCKALRRIASPPATATRNYLAEIARTELRCWDKESEQE